MKLCTHINEPHRVKLNDFSELLWDFTVKAGLLARKDTDDAR